MGAEQKQSSSPAASEGVLVGVDEGEETAGNLLAPGRESAYSQTEKAGLEDSIPT